MTPSPRQGIRTHLKSYVEVKATGGDISEPKVRKVAHGLLVLNHVLLSLDGE